MQNFPQPSSLRILTTPWGRSLIRFLVFFMIFQGVPWFQTGRHDRLRNGHKLSVVQRLNQLTGTQRVYASEQCPADFDGSGTIDDDDLAVFADAFGSTDCTGDCPADFDNDHDVDGIDARYFSTQLGMEDCPGALVEVPDVVGMYQTDGQSAITAAGLTLGPVSEAGSDTVPVEHIIGQIPPAGSQVQHGSEVSLLVSTGPEEEDPLPDGSFAGDYEELIPPDAYPGSHDINRFAVITGLVMDVNDNPLTAVTVSVLNHPEFGSVLTDTAGRFYLPVQGGTTYTLKYTAPGYIEAQRNVDVPWTDFAIAETPALIVQDSKSTPLSFDGNPDTALVHVGSTISDASGSRQAVVIFSGDTHATAINPDGSSTPLTGPLTIRATEFTTPESMPARLPPTSAFTYCVDLTIDEAAGAAKVEFSRPVFFFVRNFLGFDVGTRVPVGYYDRQQGVWIASDDGRVVKLLDTDSNGVIDALDADGDDLADDLDKDGSFADEVFGVEASGQYVPGDTVWQVSITHFTPMDCNYPVVPADSTPPNAGQEPTVDTPKTDDPCVEFVGSGVESRNRVFHEDLPLPGTDFNLHYASNRVDDFLYRFVLPASGDTVPASLKRIIVEIKVAGRTFRQEFPASPNQSAEFVWDGRDALGNIVGNSLNTMVRIGFVYDTFYSTNSEIQLADYNILKSWALPGGSITLVPGRAEQVMWKEYELPVTVLSAAIIRSGLGSGWTLSPHHALITGAQSVLVRGDGSQRRVYEGQNLVWTVAGTGVYGFSGDGGPAKDAQLYLPRDVAVGPDGTLYIADCGNNRVRAVDLEGNITTIAGTGGNRLSPPYFNEGGLAVEADLFNLRAVEIGPDGLLYIVVGGPGGDVVRRIDRGGNITTVAGLNGDSMAECFINGGASPGDGGPANDARLCDVNDIAIGPDGSIYIAQGRETGNHVQGDHVIRKVGPDGIIQTIAGKGAEAGSNTETDSGMPAYAARFHVPSGLSLDKDGNLLIADHGNLCVRSLSPDGVIRTVGGQCNTIGGSGYPVGTDGDPATFPWNQYTHDVLPAGDGTFYALCTGYHTNNIRRVDPAGTLHRFAGHFEPEWYGYEGDNGPAVDAKFHPDYGKMAMGPKGYIYVADYYNNVIRKIGPIFAGGHPAVNANEILIPECPDCPDYGGQGHVFDKGGKHLRTIDLETGVVYYTFLYDASDHLIGIKDRFGRLTTIQRDGSGKAVSITGPYGDVISLTVDAANNLTGVSYADGTNYTLGYNGHLLTSKTDPGNETFSYTYDSDGRFITSFDPAGGGLTINQSVTNGITTTTLTTVEGRVSTYVDQVDSTDSFLSTMSGWNGAESDYSQGANHFSATRSEANGVTVNSEKSHDPVINSPFVSLLKVSTPDGHVRTDERERTYGLDLDSDGLADTVTTMQSINGRTFTSQHDVTAHNYTFTTPEGRVTTTDYDPATLLVNKIF